MIPRYCLLMEFSVRWVSGGLSEWAWLAIRGVEALTPPCSTPQLCTLAYSKYKAYCVLLGLLAKLTFHT